MTRSTLPLARRRRLTVVLGVGFLAFAAAVLAARSAPVDGYELSIYRATPVAFWAGTLVAVLAAALVAHSAPAESVPRRLGLLLGPMAVLAVVALPILRGYYFYGAGDPLSYLGWTRLIAQERLNPVEFLYPGIESAAIFVAQLTGIPLRRALMAIPPLFVAAFVVGVALVVDRVTESDAGLVAGAFAALLLLPVNNVHTYIVPYPTSAAIFFAPIVLYACFHYVTDGGSLLRVGDRTVATPWGAALALVGIATVLYHPQVGGTVVSVLVAILGVQVLARMGRRWLGESAIPSHRPVIVPTAAVAGFFLLWAPRFDRAQDTFGNLVAAILTGTVPGGTIEAKGQSLSVLGGGIVEIFLKLFAVSAVLSLVAGLVMLAVVTRRLGRAPDRNAMLTYLTAAFVPSFVLFVAFFIASISVQQFRYLGFLMLFVTVLAAVAYADGIPGRFPRVSPSTRTALAVGLFAVLLVPQLATVFMSPYIYQPSNHVTEQAMEGYETAFEHRDSAVWYVGVRGGPRRFVDAEFGTSGTDRTPSGQVFRGKEEMIPFGVWGNNETTHYSRCRYVALTEADYEREVVMYDGFRYDAAGFEAMDTTERIHRVQSNGNFRLYVVAPEGSTCTT